MIAGGMCCDRGHQPLAVARPTHREFADTEDGLTAALLTAPCAGG